MRYVAGSTPTANSSNHDKPRASSAKFERLEKESAKAYQAFTVYRDLPIAERSLSTVSERLGKSRSLCARWSGTYEWVERTGAWDSHQEQKRRSRLATEREKIFERQLQQTQMASQALLAPMIALVKRTKSQADAFANVSTAELARLTAHAARALPAIHEGERQLTTPPVDSNDKQAAVTISGADFTWVQGRCSCGHSWDQHDQKVAIDQATSPHNDGEPAPGAPCIAKECGCERYTDESDES